MNETTRIPICGNCKYYHPEADNECWRSPPSAFPVLIPRQGGAIGGHFELIGKINLRPSMDVNQSCGEHKPNLFAH